MPSEGVIREQLAETLKAAYGRGLLSENTFSTRLALVLEGGLLRPEQIVGDLTQRGPRRFRDRLADTISSAGPRLESVGSSSEPELMRVIGLDWQATEGELLVGRSSSCDLILDDSTVSRRHLKLRSHDGHWTLKDLGSTNGTRVNGARVLRCELRSGDLLTLGAVSLRVD